MIFSSKRLIPYDYGMLSHVESITVIPIFGHGGRHLLADGTTSMALKLHYIQALCTTFLCQNKPNEARAGKESVAVFFFDCAFNGGAKPPSRVCPRCCVPPLDGRIQCRVGSSTKASVHCRASQKAVGGDGRLVGRRGTHPNRAADGTSGVDLAVDWIILRHSRLEQSRGLGEKRGPRDGDCS